MRTVLVSLSLLALVACNAPPEEPSLSAPSPSTPGVTVDDEPAPAIEEHSRVVRREAGRLLATDALALGRVARPSSPAPGLSAPEVGVGEYANHEWRLPDDSSTAPTENLPPGADEVPLVPQSRAQEQAQQARMVEDLPDPGQELLRGQIVEDLPPVD